MTTFPRHAGLLIDNGIITKEAAKVVQTERPPSPPHGKRRRGD
jgi:hypothetical protein